MALSRIDTTNMIEDVPQSKIDNNINFRNIIINGDMSIAQRGTSQASAGSAAGSYDTVDRFAFAEQLGTFTMSQETDVPTGQGFAKSLKLDCTTADASPASNAYLQFIQRVEGQNLQYLKKGTSSAESLTMSFWVKSSKTGTFILELDDNDNARNIDKSYTINSANTWEKKIITFDGDTTGSFDNDNGDSLRLIWWLAAGSNFTSGTLQTSWGSTVNTDRAVGQVNLADSTSNEWYVTGVQLEAGQTASEFEFLPHDVNLQRCQRYYQITQEADGSPDIICSGALLQIRQMIEGQNLQYLKKGTSSAESLTISFWVKSNKTGTYITELFDSDNSRTINKSYTIDSASTWEKKTITFAGDTSGSFNNDNGRSLDVRFWLGAGTDYTSGTLQTSWGTQTNSNRAVGQVNLADSTSNEWYITGVQLEAGTSASDFEFLPHDVNERRCQRYYFDYVKGTNQNVGMFTAYATQGRLYGHIDFPVRMRTTPSLVSSNNSGDFASRKGNTENFNNFAGFQHTGTLNCNIYSVDTITTVSSGEVVWVNTSASTSQISFQAEL